MEIENYSRELSFAADQSEKEGDYWLNKLSGDFVKTGFPYDYKESRTNENDLHRINFSLTGKLFSRIMKISGRSDVRVYVIMVTGLILLLDKYTSNKDIIVGTSIYKQDVECGEFINTVLALRNRLDDRMTYKELLLQVAQTFYEANENQNYPIEALLYKLNIPFDHNDFPLFDIAVLLENFHYREYIRDIRINMIFSFLRTDESIEGILEYNSFLFKKDTVARIIKHFLHTLEKALFNIDSLVSGVEIVTEDEKMQLLVDFNNNKAKFSRDKTICQLFEEHAKSIPNRIAVTFKENQLSYRELNERTDRLVRHLRACGIREDCMAGILLDRSPWMVESILATWKAGGAYIPIDHGYPNSRILGILQDSNTRTLISPSEFVDIDLENTFKGTIIKLDETQYRDVDPGDIASSDFKINMNSLAYVIYTSGSTGKPKGVMVEHIGMMNHICAKINELQLTGKSVLAQNASHTFDISVWQFFTALVKGGKTVIYPEEFILDPNGFISWLIKNRVTILEVVPSYLSVMLETLNVQRFMPLQLEYLVVTGEEIKPNLVREWFALYPGIKMVNAYGPTEASDDITHYKMNKIPYMVRIPIGKPVQNLNIYIVNENMNLCPIGVKGEICVSGIGIGRGYLNDVEKTVKVFMDDPFTKEMGVRIYKTGDLGFWRPDGTIEFLGRKDYQVKIRGFRIELEEIENRLLTQCDIKEAVVIDKEDEKGNKYLCAYLVRNGKLDVLKIKEYLRESLPDYMAPTHFVELEQMPLTPNGKIDRKALPEPGLSTQPTMMYISEEMLKDMVYKDIKSGQLSENFLRKTLDNIAVISEKERLVLKEYSKRKGKDYYPLSHSQKMIYYIEKTYPGTSCENDGDIVVYRREIDRRLLEKAINRAIYRNENLRTRIVEIENEDFITPAQYISDHINRTFDYFDFSGKDGKSHLQKWIDENINEPFNFVDNDLFYFALLKLNGEESGYYIKLLHIISDGGSLSLFINEIDKIYQDLKAGKVVNNKLNPSHIQFIFDEEEYLISSQTKSDREFWLKYLLPLPQEAVISLKKGDFLNIKGDVCKLIFDYDLRSKMHEYCRRQKTSLYKLIIAALSIYVSRITMLDEFIIGTVNHGRYADIFKKMMGMFINFIPLKIKINDGMDFQDFIVDIGRDINYILKNHSRYPADVLSADLKKITGEDTKYFWNITLIGHPDKEKGCFAMEHISSSYEATPLTIHINCDNKNIDGILELEWVYQLEQFSYADIVQIHQSLTNILSDALDNPKKKLMEIELLTKEEKEQILYEFSKVQISHPYPMKEIISKMFSSLHTYILSKNGMVQPIGISGELCIGVIDISRDHLNIPDAIKENFALNPFEKGEMIFKTGELARWLPDGNIECLGRIDRPLEIGGNIIEPEEIENRLKEYRDIEEANVVVRNEKGSDKYLCAYVVSRKNLIEHELREYLSRELPSYMVPTSFVQLEKMPLTPDRKVDRDLLKTIPLSINKEGYDAPRNEIEKKLVEIWKNVLGRNTIGINDNFFMIGGDSIKTIQIASRLNIKGYKVEMRDIFQHPTISELAPLVKKSERLADQEQVRGIVPLTPIQKLFFEKARIDPHHFNQAVMLYSEERLDEKALKAIFLKLQEHHDVLRTTFKEKNGEMIQTCHGFDHPLSLQGYDFQNQENAKAAVETKANEIQASIDLGNGPLMKLGLFHLNDGDRLLIVIHHLVIDGVSWRILFEDIGTLHQQYTKGERLHLPLKTDSFKLWARKLSEYANSEVFLKEKTYWVELEASGEANGIPRIRTGFKEASYLVKDTEHQTFRLSEEDTELLLTRVNEAFHTEINDILLSALGLGIKRAWGHERLLIALEGHGREEIVEGIDLTRTVGWFTSAYPVLLDFSYVNDGGEGASEEKLARQVKEIKETLRRVPNKGIGYGILRYLTAEKYKEDIHFLLEPQIIFNYLGQFNTELEQMSFEVAKESSGHNHSQKGHREYDLDISGMIVDKQVVMTISYSKKQFKSETIKKLLHSFQSELIRIISDYSGREEKEFTPSDFTYSGLSIDTVDRLQEEYQHAIEDIYTLSPMQEGMLFHALYDDTSTAYYTQTSYRLHGEWDISFVERSLNELAKRYDILRTVFIHKDRDRPMQAVLRDRRIGFLYQDLRYLCKFGKRGDENETFIEKFKEKDRKRFLDLSKDVLMHLSILQVGNTEYEFIWSSHHILMDGWCIGLLISDFLEIYNSFLQKRARRLSEVTPYRTYIQWLEKQDKESSKDYWAHYLEGYEALASLPKKQLIKSNKEFSNQHVDFVVDKEKTTELNRLAARNQVTLNTVMQAVWGIILARYSGKRDVVFGSVVSGRHSEIEGVELMVGLFLNTVPVRVRIDQGTRFSGLLERVQDAAIDSEPHHYCTLAEIQSESILKQNLLDHFLVFENFPIAEQIHGRNEEGGSELLRIESIVHTNYDFYIIVVPADELVITIKYNANAYERELIHNVGTCFERVIEQVLYNDNDEIKINELNFLPEKKRQEILYQLNEELKNEERIFQGGNKLFQVRLNESLIKGKDKVAIEYGGKVVTYNELNKRSNYIAHWILNKGIERETFIGILVDDRMEMISTIIGVLKVGCVFIPLDSSYPNSRLELMIHSININFIIIDSVNFDRFGGDNATEIHNREFIHLDRLFLEEEREGSYSWFRSQPDIGYNPEDKVYVYYTSGTTGSPKAILGKNRSFLHFIDWEIQTFKITPGYRITQFTTPGFDPFLRDIFVTLCSEGVVCIPERREIILHPDELIKWIDEHRIHVVRCVPSLFQIITSGTLSKDNFRELKYVLLSGETANPSDLERWYEIFDERIQLVNLYGPTETTLVKIYYFIHRGDINVNRERVPIGKPIKGARAVILDERMNICDEWVKGEICIRTPFSSFGYLNNPELNKSKFIQNPFSNDPRDILYKSGDIGQLLIDGNIDVLGRVDRQVKIRGYRIELEEIESVLMKHPEVKEAVVIKKEVLKNNEMLVAFISVNQESRSDEESLISNLMGYLSERLPAYMVPAQIQKIKEIPRKPNLKVDFNILPGLPQAEKISYRAPGNDIERKLVEIWGEVLGIQKIGITDNFFELGGNSLNIMPLHSKIHKTFNVKMSLKVLFNNPVIEKQARLIKNARAESYKPIEPVEKKEYYALSYAQMRLYILQQMELKSTAYNMLQTVVMEGELSRERLTETFKKLIIRHESLRSSFHMLNETPVQKIYDDVEFKIEYHDLIENGDTLNQSRIIIQNLFVRPFDLSQAPLLRIGVIKIEEDKRILMVEMHHIISDGTSHNLIVNDFIKLQNGEELPPLRLQYKDFSFWQNSQEQREAMKKQEKYWLKQFEGEIPLWDLPTNYSRPLMKIFEGDSINFEIGPKETSAIKEWALKEDVTLFMFLLAVFYVLLSKLTGAEDIVVGTGVMGRRHPDLEPIIGMFVNMLALRNYPSGEMCFRDFLGDVRESTLNAFENQDYPFENLVEMSLEKRDASRNPLFDVVFSIRELRKDTPNIPGLKIEPFGYKKTISKFDMTFNGLNAEDIVYFDVEYCKPLFEKGTIEMYAENFKEIITIVLENKTIKIKDIKITGDLLATKSKFPQIDFEF